MYYNYNKISALGTPINPDLLSYGRTGDWVFNLNTGILFSYKSNTIGLAFFHVNKPVFDSIAPVTNYYPVRWVFHFQKQLIWKNKYLENVYITPLLVIKKGNPIPIDIQDDLVFTGIDIKKREATFGGRFGMETRDGFFYPFQRKEITLLAGYDFSRISLMYSITQLGGHLTVRNIMNQFSMVIYLPI